MDTAPIDPSTAMTRADVLAVVAAARAKGERPNLYGADLSGADLYGANLRGANLSGAHGGILRIDGLASGQVTIIPTVDGWRIKVGCWGWGALDALRDLIVGTDWPDAEGAEQDRRRPGLAAALAIADAHTAYHADALAAVVEHWGSKGATA